MARGRAAGLLATLMIMGLLGGCASAGQDPEATATEWLKRFDDGDYAGACALMVDTDDAPVARKPQERKDSCVGGLERLADQAAQSSLDEWRRSARTTRTEGNTAVIEFTAVQGKISEVRVDDVWYVADPGLGVFSFS